MLDNIGSKATTIGANDFPFYTNNPKDTISPIKIKQGSGSGLDADMVGRIPAFVAPAPNALTPLDQNGHFVSKTNPGNAWYLWQNFGGF
jgi:hypothetical protein